MARDHRRPLLQPTANFDWIIGSDDPGAAHRIAQETSWALLDRVRGSAGAGPGTTGADPALVDRVVKLAAGSGIDDIAELWADAGQHSLAGQLWRIYLLHRIAEGDPEGTADLFRIGQENSRSIHPVVAGVAEPVSPDSISALCDTILRGVFAGDLAIALERASSYCRIMALGAASLADDRDPLDAEHAGRLTTRALHYTSFADDLHAGARRWRDGTLD
ncbi:hypothetical protein ACFPZL_08205 [Leucobacter soli]|uniref:DNA-directed RNA polymerase subunit beta n=1 Tax=Leucobacter soli TaxID=2812850 RepID=A0A916K236_9MICO|nr:hypothetical protein [Leucobacter soli]CAG7622828.1 hypothetical protein LEUCIP111803_02560 [Leucobacter soli]